MEEIKKEINIYSYYDCTGIENHLKKMAEKGWLLKEIIGRNWKYRRIEPRSMSFFVSYYPKKVSFDNMTEERLKYIDDHSVAGWKFVTHIGKMHIFCNESENPVPLETNAVARVKSIHKFAKSNIITDNLIAMLIAVCYLIWMAYRIAKEPIDTLSDELYRIWLFSLYIPFSLYAITRYLVWYKKAKKAAEDGVFLETKRQFSFDSLFFVVWLLSPLAKFYTFLSPAEMVFGAVAVLLGILLIILFKVLRSAYLKKEISEKAKRAMTTVIAIVLIVGFVVGSFGIYSLFPKRSEKFKQKTEYADNMRTVTVYHDKNLPLDLEDLIDADGIVSKYKSNEWLGFVNVKETEQFVVSEEGYTVHCDIYYINYLPLYDACVEEIKGIFARDYVEVDPAPWGADKVYRIKYDDGYGNSFIICWEDRIADISFSWNPTDEQIAVASRKILDSQM